MSNEDDDSESSEMGEVVVFINDNDVAEDDNDPIWAPCFLSEGLWIWLSELRRDALDNDLDSDECECFGEGLGDCDCDCGCESDSEWWSAAPVT